MAFFDRSASQPFLIIVRMKNERDPIIITCVERRLVFVTKRGSNRRSGIIPAIHHRHGGLNTTLHPSVPGLTRDLSFTRTNLTTEVPDQARDDRFYPFTLLSLPAIQILIKDYRMTPSRPTIPS